MITRFSIPVEETACVVCGSQAAEAEASGQDYMYSSCSDTFCHVRCLSCGHIYLNPRPSPQAASIIYPDTHLCFAGTIAKSVSISHAKKRAILRRLKDLLVVHQT